MAKSRLRQYVEKFADQPIRITPYALKKTGLVQSQVFLKIEDYLLICAPFQLSMNRGIFLVVLSSHEISFFQQFQKKLCSINLTFQQTGSKKPLTLLLRGTLDRIGPIKGRQNVCMMDAAIKTCPDDLVEILGDYITSYEGLRSQFESFSGKSIVIDEPAARLMRFNNYVELLVGPTRARATLVSIAANSVTVRLHERPADMEEGSACSIRLYFQVYQFTANGKVSSLEQTGRGPVSISVALEFTPELIEIIDDYFFRQSIQARGKAVPSA
jgi:PilZN3 domain